MKMLKNKKVIISLMMLFLFVLPISLLAVENGTNTIAKTFSEGVGAAVSVVIGLIALIITSTLGLVSTLLINIIVSVAQYNNIINVDVVKTGWVIVRDLCNMFFVAIFLVIAFATILRVESYNFKKMLPKLLIYAVLINFSKTIFGLIIDASTIVMLTFVSGFANTPGQIVGLLKMDDVLSMTGTGFSDKSGFSTWGVAIGIIAGVLASVMTVVVLAVILAVLVMRIIMMWIYTILSPLAFLGFGFDPLKKFTQEIWDDFIKSVIIGPVLAFFIYLAFKIDSSVTTLMSGTSAENVEVCASVNKLFCGVAFQKYIIVIAMLMGGLKVAQKIGGTVSGIASKTENWTKGKIKSVGKSSGAAAWGGAKTVGGMAAGGIKALDATHLGGRVTTSVGWVQDRYKSAAKGAAAGAAVGSIGGLGGAGIGGFFGGIAGLASKDVGSAMDNKRKLREAQGKIEEKDNLKGGKDAFYSHNGIDYKMDEKDGKFKRFDKKASGGLGEWANADGSLRGMAAADDATTLKIGKEDLVNRTAIQKGFSAHYRAATNKGKASRDVTDKEGVDKAMKDYSGMSNEDLKRLFATETDKKKSKALAMLLKDKFKESEHEMVNKAKDLLSGNELMSKDFADGMIKNNAALYYTRSEKNATGDIVAKIDENALAKALSEAKFKLEDQNLANINADSMKMYAKILGNKFEAAANKMVKNTADTDKFKKIFEDGIVNDKIKDFTGDDLAIRRAFSKVTGDIHTGFMNKDKKIEGDGVNELGKYVSNLNVKGYKDISDDALKNGEVQAAVRDSLNANAEIVRNINKDRELEGSRIKIFDDIKNGITPTI